MSPPERRREPRIATRCRAQVIQEIAETGERLEGVGTTTDVSEVGVRFQGKEVFDPYREVEIKLDLGKALIEAKGRVVHLTISSNGSVSLGIEFLDLCEKDKSFLEQYCRTANCAK